MTQFLKIDLFDFDNRKEAIAKDLMTAASEHGFFYVVNHAIPVKNIDTMFNASHSFFDLPDFTKENYPMDHPRNAGWEKLPQESPSDIKESIQFSFHNAFDLRPSEKDVPGLNNTVNGFMEQCNQVSQQLLVCFAIGLGFPSDFFTRCHDISQPDCLNSLRCIRYSENHHQINSSPQKNVSTIGMSRVGAHTNINTFSLLFQQPKQDGFEVYHNNTWTLVNLQDNEIVCNVGDMISRWSDDRLQSKLHCIRNPINNNKDPRYLLEYINEANRSVIIQGRTKYTKPITTGEILMRSMEKNYNDIKRATRSNQTVMKPLTRFIF